jgi:hypothetical protein
MCRQAAALVLAFAGCGRIDFAPLAVGSACTALVPPGASVSGTLVASSATSGTCGGDATSEDVYVLDVVVPGGDILAAADYMNEPASPVLYIRTDCADAQSELACDTSNGVADLPEIHLESVPVGRYYVFVDGRATGTYTATIQTLLPEGASCDVADTRDRCNGNLACTSGACMPSTCAVQQAFTGAGPFTATVNTTAATNLHAGGCGQGGDGGLRAPEAIFTVDVATPMSDVVVSTDDPATDFDTLVYVRSSCDAGEVACDDDSGSNGNSLTSVAHTGPIAAGTYYVFVDGFAYHAGTAQVTITLTP